MTLAILLLASMCIAVEEPRRVLLLDTFQKQFAPFDVFKATFRNQLAEQFPERVVFYEISVEPGRLAGDQDERSLLDYVLSSFKEQRLDLIVTMGGPATRFAQKYRDQLFASTPLLFALVDERQRDKNVIRNTATVAVLNDAPLMIETILKVLPETKNIVVVIGRSPLEQAWRVELGHEFQRFHNRVTFTWFDTLSFSEMLKRSATLSANSAIFYTYLTLDAAGITHTSDSALSELRGKANAPIFGIQSPQLGKGIVGGPLLDIEDLSRKTAAVAVRLLNKEAPENIKVPPQIPGSAVFDWRELRRWNINESRLPSGSIVRFRSPTAWDAYKWYVLVGIALGTILVFSLGINLVKRKRAAEVVQDFNRRLIQAQEAERFRLAGELHEDITQRLACLAIEIKQEATVQGQATAGTMGEMHEEVVRLCEDVRSLAYKLHPSLIEHLGFVRSLQTECERFSGQTGIVVDTRFQDIQHELPNEAALCLFRVAEEALRNVSRHSQAKTVIVQLNPEKGGMRLVIRDDGVGFDLSQRRPAASVGLPSMRERVELRGGNLDIQSKPGYGTTVSAWIPLVQEDKRRHLSA